MANTQSRARCKECGQPAIARALCVKHYYRDRRGPRSAPTLRDQLSRLSLEHWILREWAVITIADDCCCWPTKPGEDHDAVCGKTATGLRVHEEGVLPVCVEHLGRDEGSLSLSEPPTVTESVPLTERLS